LQLLDEKNPNVAKPGASWFQGIPKENHKFVPYNGGFSDAQIQWLRETLAEVVRNHERCFIFSHCPVDGRATYPSGLSWNNEQILSILHDVPRGHILAFISGHNHDGAYFYDYVSGIHHLTPPSPLEVDFGDVAYGIVHVHDDTETGSGGYFELEWAGQKRPPMSDYEWPISPQRMMFAHRSKTLEGESIFRTASGSQLSSRL
jgi:hypothetical protein